MFAALPMYDRPANRAAHDAVWALIRDHLRADGIAAPAALDRTLAPADGWAREDLVLGQICNLPWRMGLAGSAARIGTCDYAVDAVAPGQYRSLFVVRMERGDTDPLAYTERPLAINEPGSQSGWGAPQAFAAASGRTWSSVIVTGAHAASVQAVAEGRADIAAIDAHTWRLLGRECDPNAARLKVIGATAPSPGMTLITRLPDPAPVRAAVEAALSALPASDRSALGLRSVVDLPDSAYDIPLPPAPPQWASA